VGEFVREGEDLRSLRVGAVDEDNRRQDVRQGEPAKLLGIQPAVGVRADDAAHHDQDAGFLGMLGQPTERGHPRRELGAPLQAEPERLAQACGSRSRILIGPCAAHDAHRLICPRLGVLRYQSCRCSHA